MATRVVSKTYWFLVHIGVYKPISIVLNKQVGVVRNQVFDAAQILTTIHFGSIHATAKEAKWHTDWNTTEYMLPLISIYLHNIQRIDISSPESEPVKTRRLSLAPWRLAGINCARRHFPRELGNMSAWDSIVPSKLGRQARQHSTATWRFPEIGLPPKSSILIGFFVISQPFGIPPFMVPSTCQLNEVLVTTRFGCDSPAVPWE